MGIQVDTHTVREAARALAEVERGVSKHHPDQHLPPVASAVAGGGSQPAAQALASGWSEEYQSWHEVAAQHMHALQQAAETHDAADQTVGRAHDELAARLAGPDGQPSPGRR